MPRLFVENLTVLDCAFLHLERGLLGESWIVDLELEGELDHQGMVLDFSEVKRSIKQALDAAADHRLLIPADAREVDYVETDGIGQLIFLDRRGQLLKLSSPASAIRALPMGEISPTGLATVLVNDLLPILPPNAQTLGLKLRNEAEDRPYYHYCHGLKQHAGDCQRIAHGHRSRIMIQRNGRDDHGLEEAWAERWQDIYIGSREDLIDSSDDRLQFAYRSAQGEFMLELPSERVSMIDGDSTVERLAEHIADTLAAENPGDRITVRAYEGVHKGAIATSESSK